MKISKNAILAGVVLGCAAALPIAVLAPGRASVEKKAPFRGRNFAHRGLHTPDKSVPENSLAAFEQAVQAGYGIELDVRLTKDGTVVVFHDDSLSRLCKLGRRVNEMDYEELCELRLCGTDQKIPLFSEVLKTVDGRVPLIVELKENGHNRDLCEKVVEQLNRYHGKVCVESFNPMIVAWFRFRAPSFLRGQLATTAQSYLHEGRSPVVAFVLSHTLLNFITRPHFIAYQIGPRPLTVRIAEFLGAMRVGWTAHSPVEGQDMDTIIFEHYRPEIRFK